MIVSTLRIALIMGWHHPVAEAGIKPAIGDGVD